MTPNRLTETEATLTVTDRAWRAEMIRAYGRTPCCATASNQERAVWLGRAYAKPTMHGGAR